MKRIVVLFFLLCSNIILAQSDSLRFNYIGKWVETYYYYSNDARKSKTRTKKYITFSDTSFYLVLTIRKKKLYEAKCSWQVINDTLLLYNFIEPKKQSNIYMIVSEKKDNYIILKEDGENGEFLYRQYERIAIKSFQNH